MDHPKVGMHYSDVKTRLKRINNTFKQGHVKDVPRAMALKKSLVNQVRLHEGEGGAKEVARECDPNNHSSNRVGGGSDLYRERFDQIDWSK